MEPRNFCPRCAIKHLAQARALLLEVRKGYPIHVWYAIGHMAEAEDEIVTRMPDEAALIREERLKLEKNLEHFVEFDRLVVEIAKGAMIDDEREEISEPASGRGRCIARFLQSLASLVKSRRFDS